MSIANDHTEQNIGDTPIDINSEVPATANTTPIDEVSITEEVVPRKQDAAFDDEVLIHEKGVEGREGIALPTDHRKETIDGFNNVPSNLHITDDTRLWATVLDETNSQISPDDVARNALERESSIWRQFITSPAGRVYGSYPKVTTSDVGSITGDSAITHLMRHRKLGAMYRIPLWNSGIWLVFKAPSESSLLELHRNLTNDKIDLGRRSYGLSYSSVSAIYHDRVTAFALEHLHSSTLKLEPGFNIRDVISAHDLNAIVIGLASTIWPNGFNYARACIADAEKCQHTVEEIIKISKTLLVDTTALTQWQIVHMSKIQANSVTLEEVKRYQEELVRAQKYKTVIDEGKPNEVTFILKVPSVTEYVNAGHKWISEMANMVDNAFNREISNDERNEHIISYGKASSMRQFSHWVSAIEAAGKVIDNPETIENGLATLSADDGLRQEFQKIVAKFQSNSTITLAAIPSFKCPNCGKVNESSKHHPNITDAIPYDVFNTFFVVLARRIQRILER